MSSSTGRFPITSAAVQTHSSDSSRKRKFSSSESDSWNVGDSRKRINRDCLGGSPFVEEEHETNESQITDEEEEYQSISSNSSSAISTELTLFDDSWEVGIGRICVKVDFLEPKSLIKSKEKIDLSGFQGVEETEDGVSTKLKLCEEDPWKINKPFLVQNQTTSSDMSYEPNNISKPDFSGPKIIDLSGFQNRPDETEDGVSTKLKLYEDPWKIKKTLTKSDCSDNLHRIVFPKVGIEKHVKPQLKKYGVTDEDIGEGIDLMVWDYDTETEHIVIFKKCVSNKSYIFGTNWKIQFVDRRELQTGDEIGLFWDDNEFRFGFRVLSRARAE